MRAFYTLGFQPENQMGNGLEAESWDLAGLDHLVLDQCEPLGQLPAGLVFHVKYPTNVAVQANVIANGVSWKIIGEELAECIRSVAGEDVELLEVPVRNEEDVLLLKKFYAINPLRMLDALSEKKSVRSVSGKSILRLGIAGRRVPKDIHIFRLKSCRWDIVLDDILMKAMRNFNHDGLGGTLLEQE